MKGHISTENWIWRSHRYVRIWTCFVPWEGWIYSMPADMKHYVKSSVRKRSTGLMGSKEKGESGGSMGLLGSYFLLQKRFVGKNKYCGTSIWTLTVDMWREIQHITWKSTKETNRPSLVMHLNVGLKPIVMITVVKKTPLNMCRQQTCLKWIGVHQAYFQWHNWRQFFDLVLQVR